MADINATQFSKEDFNTLSSYVMSTVEGNIFPMDLNNISQTTNYPNSLKLANLVDCDEVGEALCSVTRQLIAEIDFAYSLDSTLAAYYPPDGFIDWHTNANFELYNAICTYSQSGNSFFEYEEGGNTTRVNDPIGWSVKKSKWGEEAPINHRAVANGDRRITLTFSSKVEADVDAFISYLLS